MAKPAEATLIGCRFVNARTSMFVLLSNHLVLVMVRSSSSSCV